MSGICHWSCMTADPISAAQWREWEIIQTATKDMLTLNSADETDKSDNTAVSIAHNQAQQIHIKSLTLMSRWRDDGVMENVSVVFISSTSVTEYTQISIM